MTLEIQTKCKRKKRPAFDFDCRNLVLRDHVEIRKPGGSVAAGGRSSNAPTSTLRSMAFVEMTRNGFLWRPRAQDLG